MDVLAGKEPIDGEFSVAALDRMVFREVVIATLKMMLDISHYETVYNIMYIIYIYIYFYSIVHIQFDTI